MSILCIWCCDHTSEFLLRKTKDKNITGQQSSENIFKDSIRCSLGHVTSVILGCYSSYKRWPEGLAKDGTRLHRSSSSNSWQTRMECGPVLVASRSRSYLTQQIHDLVSEAKHQSNLIVDNKLSVISSTLWKEQTLCWLSLCVALLHRQLWQTGMACNSILCVLINPALGLHNYVKHIQQF